MNLNEFIEANYNWLLEVSTKITAKDVNNKEIRYDLLSFVVLEIAKVKDYENLEEKDYKFLFAKYLKDNYRWTMGGFWRQYKILSDKQQSIKINITENQYIDILADCKKECDEEKELLHFYSELNAEKIKFVRELEPKLPKHLRNLYEMYITEQMSRKEIEKSIQVSTSTTRNLIIELTNIILTEWENHCTSQS